MNRDGCMKIASDYYHSSPAGPTSLLWVLNRTETEFWRKIEAGLHLVSNRFIRIQSDRSIPGWGFFASEETRPSWLEGKKKLKYGDVMHTDHNCLLLRSNWETRGSVLKLKLGKERDDPSQIQIPSLIADTSVHQTRIFSVFPQQKAFPTQWALFQTN